MADTPSPEALISARELLVAIQEIERLGHRRVIESMEQREPMLAEYLLEELSQYHRALLNAGLDARTTRQLYRQVEELTLTCVRMFEIGRTRGNLHS